MGLGGLDDGVELGGDDDDSRSLHRSTSMSVSQALSSVSEAGSTTYQNKHAGERERDENY